MAKTQPNILFIFTDQQSASMMSCAGNSWVKTPAMDSIAESGVRFERAYCSNPVCTPSRFSVFTGRMPSEVGISYNEQISAERFDETMKRQSLGHLMREAGYDSAYAGRVHTPGYSIDDVGFELLTRDSREGLATDCEEFIKRERDKPFFLFASYTNPHDICYMGIRDCPSDEFKQRQHKFLEEFANLDEALLLPPGISEEEFFIKHCPPLPANFEPQKNEPGAIDYLLHQRPFRLHAREQYTDKQWRLHRWAYAKLTERVDSNIADLLRMLRESGQASNTIVVLSSDHGDHDASHRLEHKTIPYEEAANIPMIASGPGIKPRSVDKDHLISNGLDLLPTFCDYAGVAAPSDLKGRSLRPILEGKNQDAWHEFIPIECEVGQALVTSTHKYIRYDRGKNAEQLYDLQMDHGETRNAINDPDQQISLQELRTRFDSIYGEVQRC